MLRRYFAFPLVWKIFIALLSGAVLGVIMGPEAQVLAPFGELFIRLLKMIVIPIVLLTITVGVAGISPSRLGRIGGKVILFYFVTSAFAIAIGLSLAQFFALGEGLTLPMIGEYDPNVESPSLVGLILRCFPVNPFGAIAGGDPLPVIVTALLVGLGLATVRESVVASVREAAETTIRVLIALMEVVFLIVRGVLEYAPFGIIALVAGVVGVKGPAVLGDFAALVAVAYAGMALHIVLVYGGLLRLCGVPFIKFLRGVKEALLTAYATRTSSGTLPVSIACAENNLRVPNHIAGFTLSLGATINMDGTALYLAMEVVFAANVFGLDLGMTEYITIMVTALLASIGTAGVPSASLIMLTTVLESVRLKPTIVPLLAGFDPICDMMRTVTNVCGDLTGTVVVAKSEGELDMTSGIWTAQTDDGSLEEMADSIHHA
jgi:Na+/H+-dicarboxylate symporter